MSLRQLCGPLTGKSSAKDRGGGLGGSPRHLPWADPCACCGKTTRRTRVEAHQDVLKACSAIDCCPKNPALSRESVSSRAKLLLAASERASTCPMWTNRLIPILCSANLLNTHRAWLRMEAVARERLSRLRDGRSIQWVGKAKQTSTGPRMRWARTTRRRQSRRRLGSLMGFERPHAGLDRAQPAGTRRAVSARRARRGLWHAARRRARPRSRRRRHART